MKETFYGFPIPNNEAFCFCYNVVNVNFNFGYRNVIDFLRLDVKLIMSVCLFVCLLAASRIRYEITSGNIGGAFAVKNMTGAIYVAGALDYETRKRVSRFSICTHSTSSARLSCESIFDTVEVIFVFNVLRNKILFSASHKIVSPFQRDQQNIKIND